MSDERAPRRWTRALWACVALAVLVGGAELALRLIVPQVITDAIRTELQLSEDHPVDVSLGGLQVLSAIRGGVGDATVSVPDVPVVEGISVDGEAHADFVSFDVQAGEVRGGTAQLTVRKDRLEGLLQVVTNGLIDTGSISKGSVTVGKTIDVFGQQVPLTATIGLTAQNGDVLVTPEGVTAAGFDFDTDQLRSATGSLLEPILETQTVCIRDRIPAGITLTGIELSSTGSATLSARLNPGILSDPRQLENGSCEAG